MSVLRKDRALGYRYCLGKALNWVSVFVNIHVFAESFIRRVTKNLLLSINEISYL